MLFITPVMSFLMASSVGEKGLIHLNTTDWNHIQENTRLLNKMNMMSFVESCQSSAVSSASLINNQ